MAGLQLCRASHACVVACSLLKAQSPGEANGLGKALVELLHQRGARPVFCDLDITAGDRLVSALGNNADFVKANATDWRGLRGVFSQTNKKNGHIDIALANAGMIRRANTWEDKLVEDGDLAMPGLLTLDVYRNCSDIK